jgi:hypothetical protein
MATALLRLSATADEAATVYGVVLPTGATPPSATEVRHPQLLQRHTVLLAAAQAAMVAEAAAAAVADATTPRLGGSSKPSAAVGTLEVRISCCCLCSMAFSCLVANATSLGEPAERCGPRCPIHGCGAIREAAGH